MKVGRFNLGNLSKYRTELMGLSALLILFCHLSWCDSFHDSVRTPVKS